MTLQDIIVGRSPEDLQHFGEKGTGYVGKHYVGSKKEAYLANKIKVDFLRPHLIGIFGKRGTGKSYTLGIIAEEIMELEEEVKKNIGVLLIDTMGIYWSMRLPNKKDKQLLMKWGIEPKGYSINLIIPQGLEKKYLEMGMDYNQVFSIAPKEISFEEWCYLFGFDQNSEFALIINKVLDELKDEESYSLDDMIEIVENLFANEREAKIVKAKLERAKQWELFSEDSQPLRKLVIPGKINILDISQLGLELGGWGTRSLIIGILARKLLMYRIESRKIEEQEKIYEENLRDKYPDYVPVTWLLIDEAHQFLPAKGENAATLPLLQIIKIGREPGVSLVLATQMPYKLNTEAISQADLVISHRLTAKKDIAALSEIMQTYQRYDLAEYFDAMPREKGSAIILDDNSERIYEIRIRPRRSWHAGESAIAINQ